MSGVDELSPGAAGFGGFKIDGEGKPEALIACTGLLAGVTGTCWVPAEDDEARLARLSFSLSCTVVSRSAGFSFGLRDDVSPVAIQFGPAAIGILRLSLSSS